MIYPKTVSVHYNVHDMEEHDDSMHDCFFQLDCVYIASEFVGYLACVVLMA